MKKISHITKELINKKVYTINYYYICHSHYKFLIKQINIKYLT